MKTILSSLLLGCAVVMAQIPPPTPANPAGAESNREEALRQAVRRAVDSKSELPAVTVAAVPVTNEAAPPPPVIPARIPPPTLDTNRPAAVVPAAVPGAAVPPGFPAGPANPPPLAPSPSAPSTPLTPDPNAASAAPANRPVEDVIPPGVIKFQAVDLAQVLDIYAELVNRTILRPTTLPAPVITLKTQTALTKSEAIQALDAVLGMNGIVMINVGDKFVKAVPSTTAGTAGAKKDSRNFGDLPEIGQYVTHIYKTKFVKPTELVTVLQPFANIPNAVLPIDSSQILVLRDFTENVKRMLELIEQVDTAIPSEFDEEVIPIKYSAGLRDRQRPQQSQFGRRRHHGRSGRRRRNDRRTLGFRRQQQFLRPAWRCGRHSGLPGGGYPARDRTAGGRHHARHRQLQ